MFLFLLAHCSEGSFFLTIYTKPAGFLDKQIGFSFFIILFFIKIELILKKVLHHSHILSLSLSVSLLSHLPSIIKQSKMLKTGFGLH